MSAEAVADKYARIIEATEEIAKIAENIAVKVPLTPDGLKASQILRREKQISTNVTMVFSAVQAALAMKSGASFVSIVVSRLDGKRV